MGKNGAGKSTLLKIIAGKVNHQPEVFQHLKKLLLLICLSIY
jgi:ABC-type multidrug transport system ATPase subunit